LWTAVTTDGDHTLHSLLGEAEVRALGSRIEDLLEVGRLPQPDEGYHSVPWPMI
jgi:hypothetical protein